VVDEELLSLESDAKVAAMRAQEKKKRMLLKREIASRPDGAE
jgi:hypothetical protein